MKKIINIFKDRFYRDKFKIGLLKEKDKYDTIDDLIYDHFKDSLEHPCIKTLKEALKLGNKKPLIIIETGSSAWGANSTVLFDNYVNSWGGYVYSTDIRAKPMLNLRNKVTNKTILYCQDSIKFLKKIDLANFDNYRKLIYLDSMDVDWEKPVESMIHGLREYLAILPKLKKNDIILIDDTPKDLYILKKVQGVKNSEYFAKNIQNGIHGGKGSLIRELIFNSDNFEILIHDYQLLFQLR